MRFFLLFFLSVFYAGSCASSSDSNESSTSTYTQNIDVPPGEDSVKMVIQLQNVSAGKTKLVGMLGDQRFFADSAVVDAQGKIVLTRKTLLPQGFYYFILPGNKALQFVMDYDQRFELVGDINRIQDATVTGSECLELYFKNMKFQKTINPKIKNVSSKMRGMAPSSPDFGALKAEYDGLVAQLDQELEGLKKNYPNNFFTKFKVGGKNPVMVYPKKPNGTLDTAKQVYLYRNAFWEGYDFTEVDLLRTPVFSNKMKRFFTELVPLNQDSIIKYTDYLVDLAGDNKEYFKSITNWVALKFEPGNTNLMDSEAVYSHIILNHFTPEKVFWGNPEDNEHLRKRASEMTHSLIGKKAANVTAKDAAGRTHTLLDNKSPLLIVYIYSPDCEHCQEETPTLINQYQQLKARGVDIFSIAANTTEKEWREFGNRFKMPWVDVFDATNSSWYPGYFVDITPEIYVLDQERKIVGKNISTSQLPIIINRYLK